MRLSSSSSAKKILKKSFSKRNGVAEVEENDFNDTLVHDVDAHKVNLAVSFSVWGRSYLGYFSQ